MQLLKITTTPIKYRVETERASFTLADSDNYDSLGSVKESVRKIDTAKNAANNLKSEVSSSNVAQLPKRTRQDKTFERSGGQFSSYDVKYHYGIGNNNVSDSKIPSDKKFVPQKAVSMDRAFYEIHSLKPDESWEPDVKAQSNDAPVQQNIDVSPELEFNPATYKFVVEEFADVKIEYLGGFNYFPKSSAPDYEEEENT